jgi:hypothetical protein
MKDGSPNASASRPRRASATGGRHSRSGSISSSASSAMYRSAATTSAKRLAHVAHAFVCDRLLKALPQFRTGLQPHGDAAQLAHVARGEHGEHARPARARSTEIPRTRACASRLRKHRGVSHVRHTDIRDVAARPRDKAQVFMPRQTRPDVLRHSYSSRAQALGRRMDGQHDVQIARAATKIAGERDSNLPLRWDAETRAGNRQSS